MNNILLSVINEQSHHIKYTGKNSKGESKISVTTDDFATHLFIENEAEKIVLSKEKAKMLREILNKIEF